MVTGPCSLLLQHSVEGSGLGGRQGRSWVTPPHGKGRWETSALTSTRHSSEDPALAVLDWLAPKILPPLKNIHAPNPGHGAHPIFVLVVPPPRQHPPVLVVTVYLRHDKRGRDGGRAGHGGTGSRGREPHSAHPGAIQEGTRTQAEAVRERGVLSHHLPLHPANWVIITGEEQKLLPGWCIPTSPVSPLFKGS